jgi:hypothetical protein
MSVVNSLNLLLLIGTVFFSINSFAIMNYSPPDKTVMTYLKELCIYLPREAKENHEMPQL